MKEQTFKLNESQIKFLERCKEYGFKTPNELVITAIQRLQSELESENLQESAELYAEIYAEDEELQELTESGLKEWPQE
ncbi:hypothetical protein [Planktothrix pseudagardhii]|uniref:Uncharacterized protein n=1 Tax=Planktothrix pseudagardhii TaxID=132604 RepID=A0A9W4CG48_9CYAN|nr:hypothetical protein [Planktothrix pseudagardhii]CAD5926903.1 hypothetical protein NO713_01033 [Planktothrix pseudagardhii]